MASTGMAEMTTRPSQDERTTWCLDQTTTCKSLCGGNGSTLSNTCSLNTLDRTCTCQDGSQPDLSLYAQTISWYQCMTACSAQCGGYSECQSTCEQQNFCGTINLDHVIPIGSFPSSAMAITTQEVPSAVCDISTSSPTTFISNATPAAQDTASIVEVSRLISTTSLRTMVSAVSIDTISVPLTTLEATASCFASLPKLQTLYETTIVITTTAVPAGAISAPAKSGVPLTRPHPLIASIAGAAVGGVVFLALLVGAWLLARRGIKRKTIDTFNCSKAELSGAGLEKVRSNGGSNSSGAPSMTYELEGISYGRDFKGDLSGIKELTGIESVIEMP